MLDLIMVRNIVVVGGKKGGHPAELETRLDPVRLNEGVGVAITSIMYGEVCNICQKTNKIYYTVKNVQTDGLESMELKPKKHRKYSGSLERTIRIPKGTYTSTRMVAKAIVSEITNDIKKISSRLPNNKQPSINIPGEDFSSTYHISLSNMEIGSVGKDTPWGMLGVTEGFSSKSPTLQDIDLTIEAKPAFLYTNIVENSYINDKKTRNLAVLPIFTRRGYTHFEFQNPVYVPVEIREFSSIHLELYGLDGKLIEFNDAWDTIITLRMKPINRGALTMDDN